MLILGIIDGIVKAEIEIDNKNIMTLKNFINQLPMYSRIKCNILYFIIKLIKFIDIQENKPDAI